MRRDGFDQRQKRQVEKQRAIFGVIGDPRDLVRMESWIDRMQHAARTRNGEVKLHVPISAPAERCHTLSPRDAKPGKRVGHLACTSVQSAVRGAMHVAFDAARDDLNVGVVPIRVLDQ